jgi:hypothetical protein
MHFTFSLPYSFPCSAAIQTFIFAPIFFFVHLSFLILFSPPRKHDQRHPLPALSRQPIILHALTITCRRQRPGLALRQGHVLARLRKVARSQQKDCHVDASSPFSRFSSCSRFLQVSIPFLSSVVHCVVHGLLIPAQTLLLQVCDIGQCRRSG